jgi:hypothetical protein
LNCFIRCFSFILKLTLNKHTFSSFDKRRDRRYCPPYKIFIICKIVKTKGALSPLYRFHGYGSTLIQVPCQLVYWCHVFSVFSIVLDYYRSLTIFKLICKLFLDIISIVKPTFTIYPTIYRKIIILNKYFGSRNRLSK